MAKSISITETLITDKIFVIREQKMMLDFDLAEMYDINTKVLKQAVRRNIDRFPEDFMFEMTEEELTNWRSHFVTSNSLKMGLRYKPFCFTEHRVLMSARPAGGLSSVLRSDRTVQGIPIAIGTNYESLQQDEGIAANE